MDFVAGGELFSLLRKSQVGLLLKRITSALPEFGSQVLRCRSGFGVGLSALFGYHI
jgi:hypothetical protein